jgi:PKHD-type hydroxylase
MIILLQGVLEPTDVARVLKELAPIAWRAGAATAGPTAREVKDNLQAPGADPIVAGLERFVADALARHPMFELAARPKRLSRILFSRYTPGMAYGPHTDDAMMGADGQRMRADLSFTLFLSPPESYSGGALAIHNAAGAQAVRLEAGDAVLYSSGSIHEVEPVTSGERVAAVGWVQSVVRENDRREILFDLAAARQRLTGAREERLLLDKAISNLLRLWADP